MARTSRDISSTGIYHVMMRGINHRNIYRDNADKAKFLKIMQFVLSRRSSLSGKPTGEYEVYAYALMGNHFHLLIKVISGRLGDFVKALASGYVLYFNKKYNRDGHLFKERFKSEPCESEEYFSTLLRYIHRNPIKDGYATDLMKYRYTSWQEYADPENSPFAICNVEGVLNKIPFKELERNVYSKMSEGEEKDCLDMDKKPGRVSDAYLQDYINTYLGKDEKIKDGKIDLSQLDRHQRNEMIIKLLDAGGGICQIERLTGFNKATISRLKTRNAVEMNIKSETK